MALADYCICGSLFCFENVWNLEEDQTFFTALSFQPLSLKCLGIQLYSAIITVLCAWLTEVLVQTHIKIKL